MANTPDVIECAACRRQGDARLPIDPWRSLAVHFGMLLGVEDFKTIDAYHRGKMWLHTAWLHREGVVWGLEPKIVEAQGELRIEAGLATDGCGRELHLERAACIDLAKWFAARAEQLLDNVEEADESINLSKDADGHVRLNAHVRMRFVGCLDRQVPALVEPCDGAGRTTAYSRVFETVEIELRPGLPDTPPHPYPRLRLLFGLDPGDVDPQVHSDVEDVTEALAALPPEQRPAAFETAFRELAARDAAELKPATDPDEPSLALLPAIDPAWFVLAELHELHFAPDGDGWSFEDVELRWRHRPTHVATRPLQELVATSGHTPQTVSGPRLQRSSLQVTASNVQVSSTALLEATTVGLDRVQLSAFAPGAGWQPVTFSNVALQSDGVTIIIDHAGFPAAATLVRLRIDGSSSTPVLGADGWPLAGADDDPFTPAHAGRDFIHMHRLGE